MLKRVRNTGAFTFLESILVLFITTILVSFPVLSFNRIDDKVEIDLFIEEFSSGITLMQNHAIFNQEPTMIEVEPNARRVIFRVYGGALDHPLNHNLHLPDSIDFPQGIKTYRFSQGSGNINHNDRIRLMTSEGNIEFVFQMGSGRFYVRKVEE